MMVMMLGADDGDDDCGDSCSIFWRHLGQDYVVL
jgi:hypothetical protein